APCRAIGDWSYSFYLWHWPFLVVAAGYVGHSLTVLQNLGLLVAALAISALTYHALENPFRRSRALSRKVWRGIAVYPVGVAMTLGACVAAQGVINHEVEVASGAPAITLKEFQPSAGGKHHHLSIDPAVAI